MRPKRAAARISYRVLQLDFFRNVLRVKRYSNRVNFFTDLMNNLRGLRLYCLSLDGEMKYMEDLMLYDPIRVAVRSLNGTFTMRKYQRRSNYFFVVGGKRSLMLIKYAALYPAKTIAVYYVVPVLYDQTQSTDLSGLFLGLLAFLLVIAGVQLYRKFFGIDSQTWEPLRTFSMIIAVANPRDPVRFAETVAFTVLIAMGFFFGGDLAQSLISVNVEQNVQRPLETVADLVENNITFVFLSPWQKQDFEGMPNVKWIPLKSVKTMFTNLLFYKNESVPSFTDLAGMPFPSRVVINGQVQVQKSNIKSQYSVTPRWFVPTNCPWLNRLKDILLRYYGSHLDLTRELVKIQGNEKNALINEPINQLTTKTSDDSDDETMELGNLWLLILLIPVLSFSALAIEILIHKLNIVL